MKAHRKFITLKSVHVYTPMKEKEPQDKAPPKTKYMIVIPHQNLQ